MKKNVLRIIRILLLQYMIVFQVFIKFGSSERSSENTMPHLFLGKYKWQVFRSTILHHGKKLNIFTF